MKPRRWNAAEFWLILAPIAFFACAILFFAVKRANSPQFVPSQHPVARAYFVDEKRLLTVEQPKTPQGAQVPPILNLYETQSGARLMQMAWPRPVLHVEISRDAQWLVVFEGAYGVPRTVSLARVDGLGTVYHGADIGSWADFYWTSDDEFVLEKNYDKSEDKKYGEQGATVWKIENSNFTKVRDSSLFALSPKRDWRVNHTESKPVIFEMHRVGSDDSTSTMWPQKSVLHSQKNDQKVELGSNVRRWIWSDDGQSLMGLRAMYGPRPSRFDIVRHNTKTQKKSAVRVVPDVHDGYFWNTFALNNRLCIVNDQIAWKFLDTQTGQLVREIPHEVQSFSRSFGQASLSENRRQFLRPTSRGVEIYELSHFVP